MIEFPVPETMVEHASRFYAAGATPVEPRVAATVLLLRPASPAPPASPLVVPAAPLVASASGTGSGGGFEPGSGFEVYLLRRVAAMAFGGMYAFPGGAVDAADAGAVPGWAGPEPAEWGRRLGCSPERAQLVVRAAIREVFEEAGVLLAGPDADTVVGDVSGAEWEADRRALLTGTLSFAELLRRRGLTIRADLLAAWSRWITPEFEPRRFDTYFFVAPLPAGQRTRDVCGEADHTMWIRPAEALTRTVAGEIGMLPPTRVTLDEVAACGDVAEVVVAAAGRDASAPVTPELRIDPDGTVRFTVPTTCP